MQATMAVAPSEPAADEDDEALRTAQQWTEALSQFVYANVTFDGPLNDSGENVTMEWVAARSICGDGICAPDELYFEGGQFWSSCPQDCESNSDCGYGARPRYLAVGREMRYDGQFEPRHLRQLDLVRPQTCHF